MTGQSRRRFLKTIGGAAVSAGSFSILSSLGLTRCAPDRRQKPNVILVMTDDQGYGDIGAHGSPYVKAPTLDKLYMESIRLTNFHVDPCAPTRASLLTGQYSARSGVWHTIGGRSLLEKDKVTIADVFRAGEYRTAIFGKWHLGDNYPFRPQDRGFDEDLARLLKEIRELGLEHNTILIFMTDNGPCPWYGGIIIDEDGFVEEGYSAGMRRGKIWGYENAHRVPCFIRWPAGGLKGGKDIEKLTAHFDLLPTLIDWCGLKKPEEISFDGISLAPLLADNNIAWPDRTLFVHNQRVDFPVKYKENQVLTERWRLINREKVELYDIVSDPGQRDDIAGQHPDVVKELHQQYQAWWEDISQDFDKYAMTIIGSDRENPSTLYGHDAHRQTGNNIFVIDVEKEGYYEFQLFRWPQESAKYRSSDPDQLLKRKN